MLGVHFENLCLSAKERGSRFPLRTGIPRLCIVARFHSGVERSLDLGGAHRGGRLRMVILLWTVRTDGSRHRRKLLLLVDRTRRRRSGPCAQWQGSCSLRCRPGLLARAVDGEPGAIHRFGESVLAVGMQRHANACRKLKAGMSCQLGSHIRTDLAFDSPSCRVRVHCKGKDIEERLLGKGIARWSWQNECK